MSIARVIVLDDGSEHETFDVLPAEELHLHERWELVRPRLRPFVIEHPTGVAWVPSDAAALIGPGLAHRVRPAGGEAGGLERAYVHPATARAVFTAVWRAAAERAPAVVDPSPADDWFEVLSRHALEDRARPPPSAVQPPHRGLARAVRHLESHLDRTVPLDELSSACGLSKFHLCRMFHRVVGVTPRTYHRHIRLERGRAMLLAGKPASTIARELSFSDQSHFIRSFRKQFGVTPGDFVSARRPWTRSAPAAACA